MAMIRRKLEVFADYHQFYLWDRETNPLAPTDYTDQDVRNIGDEYTVMLWKGSPISLRIVKQWSSS